MLFGNFRKKRQKDYLTSYFILCVSRCKKKSPHGKENLSENREEWLLGFLKHLAHAVQIVCWQDTEGKLERGIEC